MRAGLYRPYDPSLFSPPSINNNNNNNNMIAESDLLEAGEHVPPSPPDVRRLTYSGANRPSGGAHSRKSLGTPLPSESVTPDLPNPVARSGSTSMYYEDSGEIAIAGGLVTTPFRSRPAGNAAAGSRIRLTPAADPEAPTPEYNASRYNVGNGNGNNNNNNNDDDDDHMWLTGDISDMLKV